MYEYETVIFKHKYRTRMNMNMNRLQKIVQIMVAFVSCSILYPPPKVWEYVRFMKTFAAP